MKTIEIDETHVKKFKLLYHSNYQSIYKNKNKIWKLYRKDNIKDEWLLSELSKLSQGKIELADHIRSKEIVKPTAMLLDKHSKQYQGFEMEYQKDPSINYLLKEKSWKTQLDKTTELFLAISKGLQHSHKQDIIAPDLFSKGNLLYDTNKKSVKFLDYDGLQIQNLQAPFYCSDFELFNEFIEKYPKFYQNNSQLYTKEYDKMTLIVEYLYWCTSHNLADNLAVNQFHITVIPAILNAFGLKECRELRNYLCDLFYSTSDIPYPDEVLKRIDKEYQLVPNPIYPKASVFVKKH